MVHNESNISTTAAASGGGGTVHYGTHMLLVNKNMFDFMLSIKDKKQGNIFASCAQVLKVDGEKGLAAAGTTEQYKKCKSRLAYLFTFAIARHQEWLMPRLSKIHMVH